MKEHLHCRENAGLFDVSHMVPCRINGKDRVKFAEMIFPTSIQELPDGQGALSSLLNENGGMIDDCIITNAGDHLFLVINAGHEDIDLPHMNGVLKDSNLDASISLVEKPGLLALQGPKAAEVLQRMTSDDISQMSFMTGRNMTVEGIDCFVTRSGYTGEDGFEITIEDDEAATGKLANALLDQDEVELIGLGARDSLRLEAGLCLYGNDMDTETSPLEAGLLWTIGKRRRAEGGFVGASSILAQIADRSLVKRKRVGLTLTGRGPPPRSHDKLFNEDGEEIGEITSGVFGPSAGKAVAMGYVNKSFSKRGTKVNVQIRKKQFEMEVTRMPFVPARFFKG